MVRLATLPVENGGNKIPEPAPHERGNATSFVTPPAGNFEMLLKTLVNQAVAEHIEKITEAAVQRALNPAPVRHRVVHDHSPISDLPLPTRIAGVLHRLQIKTVAQLTALRAEDFLSSPNVGQRSLEQLRHILGLFGRSLATSRRSP